MIDCIVLNAFKFWEDKESCLQHQVDLNVSIQIKGDIDNNKIEYIAAAPHEIKTSFSGSGLPFVDFHQAFENTPNSGTVNVLNKQTSIPLLYPNSFYIHSNLVKPTLFIRYKINGNYVYNQILVGNKVPYRSLYHPDDRYKKGPMFYKDYSDMRVLSQEHFFYKFEYPSLLAENKEFWPYY